VKFVCAYWGHGKTHLLHLLQEIAYVDDFTVSTVTLSHSECPLYRFGQVYNKIMWGIRTKDQRKRPALDNILDRWLEAMRLRQRREVERIVAGLPQDMKNALVAYYEADNPINPRKEDQLAILKWLSGESGIYLTEIRKKYRIRSRVDEGTALDIMRGSVFYSMRLKPLIRFRKAHIENRHMTTCGWSPNAQGMWLIAISFMQPRPAFLIAIVFLDSPTGYMNKMFFNWRLFHQMS